MEPPRWPSTTRQDSPTHRARLLPPNHLTTDVSPSPFASKLTATARSSQVDGYVTPDRRDDTSWDDAGNEVSQDTSTIQIELAECVETKTVTTTTTTKRSYPPLFVRSPQSLESLDMKQYPLARKTTPEEISSFSYEVNGEVVHFRGDGKLPPSSLVWISSTEQQPFITYMVTDYNSADTPILQATTQTTFTNSTKPQRI